MGPVRPHPAGPADPVGSGLDPVPGDYLPDAGGELAGRFRVRAGGSAAFTGAIAKEILHELRLVYFTREQAKEAGFLETEHFGVLFPHRMSHIDLTGSRSAGCVT